ncbi:hypothetical protein [Pseudomonas sp. DG56-2]|uniref:hypothetical protein n=1 Tax=Pseudomonas sp. DG56-2 TaxID=2320270 RepID=UPI0010A68934|nr:hypothetical protein [Pseudomonas sp. DG56-2]
MFNQTALPLFNERVRKVLETPPVDLVATESELCYAAGMAAYALARGDIGHEEHKLMNMRIDMARFSVLARTLRQERIERVTRQ